MLGEAMAMANARSDLVAWGSKDSQLAARLDGFADPSIEELGVYPQEQEPDERRAAARGERPILLMTTGIGALSRDARGSGEPYDLALCEQELGEYESVIRRAGEMLGVKSPEDRVAQLQSLQAHLPMAATASRAYTKLAERLRNEGGRPPSRRLVSASVDAENDLQACGKYTDNLSRDSLDLTSSRGFGSTRR